MTVSTGRRTAIAPGHFFAFSLVITLPQSALLWTARRLPTRESSIDARGLSSTLSTGGGSSAHAHAKSAERLAGSGVYCIDRAGTKAGPQRPCPALNRLSSQPIGP
jgi:hypothetical protein